MAGEGFFAHLLKVLYSFFCGWNISLREDIGDSLGFEAHHQIERGCITCIVFSLVMNEFCHGEVVGPFSWFVAAIDPKVCFKLLVESFSLSVCLWVVGSQQGDLVVEDLSKGFCEFGGELRASI